MTQQNLPESPEQPLDYQNPHMLETNPDARLWGMLCHLAAFAGFLIPFGSIIGPLVIWQMKKPEHPFVDDQGKESLNFHITVVIALVVSGILMLAFIGFILFPIVALGALILTIIAAIRANNGEYYRYPLTLRLIK
jgi:uncharacterized protein